MSRPGARGSSLGIVALRRAWRQVRRDGDGIEAVQARAAGLASAARDDGYPRTAELALMIEVMCGPIAEGSEELTPEFQGIMANYLAALDRLQEEPAAGEVSPGGGTHGTVLLLADPDDDVLSELRRQLSHFGYAPEAFADRETLGERLAEETPRAVVLDTDCLPGETSCGEAVRELKARGEAALPILIISAQGDMDRRLEAARAGAEVYLVKPVNAHDLIDQLDQFAPTRPPEPLDIMLVEDSRTQATYFSSILQEAGMEVRVVSDPMTVLDALEEQDIDLILMDMYMPNCNGNELARVVRQVPRYASIPIVFLSAETEVERQLDAMSRGGDDFLTKPIEPTHLIRSVSIRAERARTLRSLMATDSLTGLLNHSRIKEELENEVGRTRRRGGELVFVMLDIDHFKAINDTHGHPAGDSVIRSLARVLQQRLRRTDAIGRYGGEEFAIIMPDVDAGQAMGVIDGIRRSFASIRQDAAGSSFSVTFSAGVASFPEHDSPEALTMAADEALYSAKGAGRNCVRLG